MLELTNSLISDLLHNLKFKLIEDVSDNAFLYFPATNVNMV